MREKIFRLESQLECCFDVDLGAHYLIQSVCWLVSTEVVFESEIQMMHHNL